MTNKEYHAHPAVSKSDIDLFLASPAKFALKKAGKLPPLENSALILGSATHKLTLERADFDSEFSIEPVVDKRTKAGKEAYAEFYEKLGTKTAIHIDIYHQALAMADAVLAQDVAKRFLKDGFAERSFFSSYNGLEIKCRPDFYNEKLGVIVDLKTTSNLAEFSKSVGNFNYHIQAALYTDIARANGLEVKNFLFIVVEKTAPFLVGFFELSENAVEYGRVCYQTALDKIIALRAQGLEFPATNSVILSDDGKAQTQKIQTIDLPAWAYSKGA